MIKDITLDIPLGGSVRTALIELRHNGYQALIVGGAVRDAILGIEPKDIDIEVYGTDYQELLDTLSRYGRVDIVGKSFGTILFTDSADSKSYDFSLPRRESRIGKGHKDFNVSVDPYMSIADAANRRDFTINTLSYDPLSGQLHDYHGGLSDLNNKILRHTSSQFEEDPLRILRGMQFVTRFGLNTSRYTDRIITDMVLAGELENLPKERVSEEWMKWATKSTDMSGFFPFLRNTYVIETLLYLRHLHRTPQDPIWHPEGDVEVHTTLVMQEMIRICNTNDIQGDNRAVLIFAALLHDIAKPNTTDYTVIDGATRITARGHEAQGGPMARNFLETIGIKESIIVKVVNLIVDHLAHLNVRLTSAKKRAVRRLAKRLYPATISELLLLIEADASGRHPLPKVIPEQAIRLGELATDLHVELKPEPDIITGKHLIAHGLKPSPQFGEILQTARNAQEEGIITNEDNGMVYIRSFYTSIFNQQKQTT